MSWSGFFPSQKTLSRCLLIQQKVLRVVGCSPRVPKDEAHRQIWNPSLYFHLGIGWWIQRIPDPFRFETWVTSGCLQKSVKRQSLLLLFYLLQLHLFLS